MPKYFIEVPHEAETMACIRAVEVFLSTGSHFLTNADWGCYDGEHKAWFFAEADSREEARNIVPPAYRHVAHIVQLNRFTLDELEAMRRAHQGKTRGQAQQT